MTQPLCFLQPDDIASLIAKNPDVATKLLIMLLERDDAEGEGGTDVGEMRNVIPNESMFAEELANIMKQTTNGNPPSIPTNMASLPRKADYLAALTRLPPMRQSFEVIGGLLRPHHHPRSREADRNTDSSEERVACLIRMEVLGEFVAGCVRWIEQAEREEMQGEVCDDRVAIATGNVRDINAHTFGSMLTLSRLLSSFADSIPPFSITASYRLIRKWIQPKWRHFLCSSRAMRRLGSCIVSWPRREPDTLPGVAVSYVFFFFLLHSIVVVISFIFSVPSTCYLS